MAADTAVLGAAIGLRAHQVSPFLRSLRNSGYRGDVVLVVDWALRRELRHEASTLGVRLLWTPTLLPMNFGRIHASRTLRVLWATVQAPVWRLLAALDRLPLEQGRRTRLKGTVGQLVCTPMEARFLRYWRYLRKEPHARVLLTDVRDVLFQSDPFDELPAIGLAVSIETRSYTVGTEPLNSDWVRKAYGEDVLTEIGQSPVSCVGVTYGDRRSMSAYLELMTEEILRLPAAAARDGGADTAIHNTLIWTDRLGPVHRLETLDSPVATLNGVPEEDVRLSPRGRLLNRDGSEPSVLHQYDRLPGGAGQGLVQELARLEPGD